MDAVSFARALAFGAILVSASAAGQMSPAKAADQPIAGRLKCDVASGVSFIVGSDRELECIFTPNKQPPEYYTGTIKKFGIDIGFQRKGIIVWDVISPGLKKGPGALNGKYIGASADVSLIGGVAANALVSENKITLNPLSVGVERGINIAAGIGDVELTYVNNSPPDDLRDSFPIDNGS